MAELRVGEGQQYRTLEAAAAAARPGDEVIVTAGVYRERLVANTPNVTWRSETPGAAVLAGGWDGQTVGAGRHSGQVQLSAAGARAVGFTIRNCPGRGIVLSADNTQAIGNIIDNCCDGGIIANDCADILIKDNVLTRLGMSWVAGERRVVSGSMNLVKVRNGRATGNRVSGGHGEGINCGRGSYNCRVDGNIVSDCSHLAYYFNRCVDCIIERNVAVLTRDPAFDAGESGNWPAAYVFGDEAAHSDSYPWQRGNHLLNNLAVGYGTLVDVRNNAETQGRAGYNTQLAGSRIEGNTLIAGPGTRAGMMLRENQRGRPHRDTVVRHNVIYFNGAEAGAAIGRLTGGGVTFERNAWTQQPPANMRGAGDLVGPVGLVNPGAEVAGSGATGLTVFDVDNYRPRGDSPLVGAGPDGLTWGALEPVTTEPPPDPDPDPEPEPEEGPDWAALLELTASIGEQLAVANMAGEAAREALGELLLRLDEYRVAG